MPGLVLLSWPHFLQYFLWDEWINITVVEQVHVSWVPSHGKHLRMDIPLLWRELDTRLLLLLRKNVTGATVFVLVDGWPCGS